MSAIPDLEGLFVALRESKVPVGVREALRLRQMLALGPALDREGLRLLLACVLVRSAAEREAFERVFAAWFERTVAALEEEVARAGREEKASVVAPVVPDAPDAPVGEEAKKRLRRRWRGAVVAGGVALGVVGAVVAWRRPVEEPVNPVKGIPTAPSSVTPKAPSSVTSITPKSATPTALSSATPVPPPPVTPAAHRPLIPDTRQFRALVPVIEVTLPDHGASLFALAAALVAGGAGLGLWFGLRKRAWLREPSRPAPRVTPADYPLRPPPELPAQVLLEDEEREGLVWGIGQYVGEAPTRALDVERSVRATAAAGGLPALRYRGALRFRSVWLWLDETTEDPTLPRMADEIERALSQAGLPVERASYWAVPDALYGTDGVRIAAGDLEDRHATAAVALLTDGRTLAIRYAASEQRHRIDALLRALAHWPRLGFVDFGDGTHGLEGLGASYDLPVIRPEGLVAFLTENALLAKQKRQGDTMAWAAACALSSRPVGEATAWRLGRALGLAVTPWALRGLMQEAGSEGRMTWEREERLRLLDWLRGEDGRVGESEAKPVPGETRLGRALSFWKAELDETLAKVGTRAVEIERAMLDLWDAPDQAVETLAWLARGDGKARVARELSRYTAEGLPRALRGEALVVLPWRWFGAGRDALRVRLQALGFGGAAAEGTEERMRRPGRMGVGIGMAAGLAVGALGVAVVKLPGGGAVVGCALAPAEGKDRWCSVEGAGNSRRVVAGTLFAQRAQEFGRTEGAVVRFEEREEVKCEEKVAGADGAEAVRLLCGEKLWAPRLPGPAGKARRSVVWIAALPQQEAARVLAERLLDTGSAEVVILGEQAPAFGKGPLAGEGAGGQLIVIGRSVPEAPLAEWPRFTEGFASVTAVDLERLAGELGTERAAPVRQVWPEAKVRWGEVEVQAGSIKKQSCPDGMVLIRAGTFQMGSPADEGDTDEHPQHRVTLDAFCTDLTEVTVAQYRGCVTEERSGVKCEAAGGGSLCNGDHKDRDAHPINCVDWNQAETYCRWAGRQLPTEAQWEYAARGTDGRTYPWGNKPPSNQLSWDGPGSDRGQGKRDGTSPVGTYPGGASPFGLLDMAGNVYEWTADAYQNYDAGAQTNPKKASADTNSPRVLRGGSWGGRWPSGVRAVSRSRIGASVRYGSVGFRCARGPNQ